jgi:hypothetical protein
MNLNYFLILLTIFVVMVFVAIIVVALQQA